MCFRLIFLIISTSIILNFKVVKKNGISIEVSTSSYLCISIEKRSILFKSYVGYAFKHSIKITS